MTDAGGERIGPRAGGDPARIAEGWERRFIAEGRRAQEMADLYTRLGYEVCVDPLGPGDLAEECEDCALVELLQFRVVYTRKPPSEDGRGD